MFCNGWMLRGCSAHTMKRKQTRESSWVLHPWAYAARSTACNAHRLKIKRLTPLNSHPFHPNPITPISTKPIRRGLSGDTATAVRHGICAMNDLFAIHCQIGGCRCQTGAMRGHEAYAGTQHDLGPPRFPNCLGIANRGFVIVSAISLYTGVHLDPLRNDAVTPVGSLPDGMKRFNRSSLGTRCRSVFCGGKRNRVESKGCYHTEDAGPTEVEGTSIDRGNFVRE